MDGPEMWEDYDEEIHPSAGSTKPVAESRPPEEMLEAGPRPAPILIILLIVFWLWVPFIASVVFLVVILGIFAVVEDPRLKKEDVKVELEGDSILQISGERSRDGEESIDHPETWHRVERSQGRFLRRFQLPVNSKVDEVQAKVENGVLTVKVPKIKRQPVPTRAVEIQG